MVFGTTILASGTEVSHDSERGFACHAERAADGSTARVTCTYTPATPLDLASTMQHYDVEGTTNLRCARDCERDADHCALSVWAPDHLDHPELGTCRVWHRAPRPAPLPPSASAHTIPVRTLSTHPASEVDCAIDCQQNTGCAAFKASGGTCTLYSPFAPPETRDDVRAIDVDEILYAYYKRYDDPFDAPIAMEIV